MRETHLTMKTPTPRLFLTCSTWMSHGDTGSVLRTDLFDAADYSSFSSSLTRTAFRFQNIWIVFLLRLWFISSLCTGVARVRLHEVLKKANTNLSQTRCINRPDWNVRLLHESLFSLISHRYDDDDIKDDLPLRLRLTAKIHDTVSVSDSCTYLT